VTRPKTIQTPKPAARKSRPLGCVAFVGAGPGDPELLTVRAVELLAKADVVVTESQDADFVRRFCRADVEVVDGSVGDAGQPLRHAVRARLVVKAAKGGGNVVRLLDGDPFLYATGSEEAVGCAKAGIPFEVVPGVSSITAVPAYAGIPLTSAKHREVRVVNVAEGSVDWSALGSGTATLVLLSATQVIGDAAKALIAAGRSPETPVAMTQLGTTTAQRTVTSTLERIAADVKAAKLAPPTITVVGDTVALRETLSWFETKPLFGWRVLVPRTKEQAGALSDRLRAFGAVPEEVPTIAVEPPRTPQQMERAIKGLVTGRYEWVAFTSRNAVKAVRERFEEYGLDARAFAGIKVAAVGEQTGADLLAWGIKPDLVPSGEQSAAGLLEDWPPYDAVFDPIDRVFLPRADIATENLVAGLVERGWEVDDVTAYRTVRAAPPAAPIREAIKSGGYDAVVFTSSSTVRNLVGIAGKPHPSTVIACIGPATAKTAEEHGLRVDVLAPSPSVPDLACALSEYGASIRAAAVAAGEPVLRPSQKRATARRKAT
jgi:uroporphyrinogen III methyltransferase/synthase